MASVTSKFVLAGKTNFTWNLVLSQHMCTIFTEGKDQDMRIESSPFHVDLNFDGKMIQVMFALVMGVPTDTTLSGPTLWIRNLSNKNLDLAKFTVCIRASFQVEESQAADFKNDVVAHNVVLKGHQQKLFEIYKDFPYHPNLSKPTKYQGDLVTLNFELDIEVYKLINVSI